VETKDPEMGRLRSSNGRVKAKGKKEGITEKQGEEVRRNVEKKGQGGGGQREQWFVASGAEMKVPKRELRGVCLGGEAGKGGKPEKK